jgi:hypothetical protein
MTDRPDDALDKSAAASKASPDTGVHGVPRWRRIAAAVLLFVGVLLVPLSLSAIWVRNTLLDTDQYVSTIGPLAGNSEIQHGLADRVTTALFADGTVEKRVAEVLPPRANVLAAPISSGLEGVANSAALKLFQSDRFQTLWENVNRRAHTAVVEVLTGGGSRVSTKDGEVSINLEQIFTNVKQRLDARGITVFDDAQLPAQYQSVVLIQSKQLEQAQGLVDLLQKLAWGLPVVALACIGGSIALSRNRRRRVMRAGIWIAVAVAVQLALLSVGRNFYLEALTKSGARKGSAGAVWDQLTSFLRQSGTTVIALALVVAVAAWVAGPSSGATRIRSLWTNALGGGTARDAGPVATFVARSKAGLRGAGAGVALAVLILWNHPNAITVLGVGILLIIFLAGIELIARGASTPVGAEQG